MSKPPTKPLTVILVDDHTIVRRGLAALIEMDGAYKVVAEASNGEEALHCAEQQQADLMILDLAMPRLNGLETIRRLQRQQERLKLLVLSMYDDTEFVAQALRDGASGYILKQSLDDELFDALAALSRGERYLSPAIDRERVTTEGAQPTNELTAREYEVLQLIAEGYTANEIADMMSISPHTANRHRANIMEKMAARNQIELVRLAVARGLVILKQPLEGN